MKNVMFPYFKNEADCFDAGLAAGAVSGVIQGARDILNGITSLKYGPDSMYSAEAIRAQAEIEAQKTKNRVWIGVAVVVAVILIVVLK